jgi:phthiocerol/phenolphthiocerol synthesis type-I polyketide synthase E
MTGAPNSDLVGKIAVIGLTCRLPGAKDPAQLWANLRAGKETISFFSDQELLDEGYPPAWLANPNFVKAGGVYEGPYLFDAPFFGYTPREAELIDPQHRIFLEGAWETLEKSGYDPSTYPGRISVFAGAGAANHFVALFNDPAVRSSIGSMALFTANDKDYLATRVGYKLNLRGPCVTVQTACSTSLVAVILASQSLLNYQSDLALAGGVTVNITEKTGYLYDEGGILSPDGHCRTFDAAAKGTIFSNGQGIVALKRLEDALADGDTIHGVIIGLGLNNDGSAKVGFTAPSVEGQAAVLYEALAMAGIHPESIGYVECHGTGTPIGDPIEIAALTSAFRAHTQKKSFCAVGAIKSNLGHTDAAAGVTGLIKAILSLSHKQLPPTLHFERANPEIDFGNSPFYVNTSLQDWKPGPASRRAGVNSFGIGGTNAHVIVEEAPASKSEASARPWHLLLLSAKTQGALKQASKNLGEFLRENPETNIADVAHTLQVGRSIFPFRGALVCRSAEDAAQALMGGEESRLQTASDSTVDAPVDFLFPGQGAQYPGMTRHIYQSEPSFRADVDSCAELAARDLGRDIRELLYPPAADVEMATAHLSATVNTQPALFIVEYALARLWMKWGLQPSAMIGHSIGEYAAACIAGVFSLQDALRLVVTRGSLMQALPTGSMLSVQLAEGELRDSMAGMASLSIAAINAPNASVASGEESEIAKLEARLTARQIPCRRLQTSHAFHSAMMDPILETFKKTVEGVQLNAPAKPFISNVTGQWITNAQATDPGYWVNHLRSAVRFSEGVQLLLKEGRRVLMEVGPGRTLSSLVGRHRSGGATPTVIVPSLPPPQAADMDADQFLMNAAGTLWLNGVSLRSANFYQGERRTRVPLPTYPFERQTYRLLRQGQKMDAQVQPKKAEEVHKQKDIAKWFYQPIWKQSAPQQRRAAEAAGSWVVFMDPCGLGELLKARLRDRGDEVFCVYPGNEYRSDGGTFTVVPGERDHYVALVAELRRSEKPPAHFLHLWSVTRQENIARELDILDETLRLGFYSLIALAQSIGSQYISSDVHLHVVANNIHDVTGKRIHLPSRATLVGPAKTISREYPMIKTRLIDVELDESYVGADQLVQCILDECEYESFDDTVIYRGGYRWTQGFEPFLFNPEEQLKGARHGGAYLITGGLGGIGLVFAQHLASQAQARLALLGRSFFPAKNEWDSWIECHGDEDRTSRKIAELRAMEAAGAEVRVFSADVSNREQMREVVRQARLEFGTVNGVIHAAGVPGNGVIDLKTAESAYEVLAPKVHGTLVLDELFENERLDFFVLCSSLTAFFGAAGQSDYTGANSFLDAYAHSRKDMRCFRPISINWDRWNEVGMAVAALRGELAKPAVPEDKPLPVYEPVAHSVFVGRYREGSAETVFGSLKPADHWIVGDHTVMGTPTLVGTAYLELARAAHAFLESSSTAELRDIAFLSPLTVKNGVQRDLRVVMTPAGDWYDFQVRSKVAGVPAWQDHAVGKIRASRSSDATPSMHIQRLLADFNLNSEGGGAPNFDENSIVQAGERWHCISALGQKGTERLAIMRLPAQFEKDFEDFELHPALLDCATAIGLAGSSHSNVYLPSAYDKVVVHKGLSGTLYSRATQVSPAMPNPEILSVDVDIFDEHGQLCVEIEGYTLKRVPDSVLTSWNQTGAQAPKTFAAEDWGILSAEGCEIFRRVVSSGLKSQHVAIASTDLNAILQRMRSVAEGFQEIDTASAGLGVTHPRPNLANPYTAPRTDLEQSISEIWQSVLGIDKVGIHDNFMELGGDSLMAVQVASRTREVFEIDLPVAKFYKNPTVVGLAEAIVQALASQLDSDALAQALKELSIDETEGSGELAANAAVAATSPSP